TPDDSEDDARPAAGSARTRRCRGTDKSAAFPRSACERDLRIAPRTNSPPEALPPDSENRGRAAPWFAARIARSWALRSAAGQALVFDNPAYPRARARAERWTRICRMDAAPCG